MDIEGLKDSGELKAALTGYAGDLAKNMGGLATNVLSQGIAFFNLITLLVITPVVAFYLLRDWDRIVDKVDSWIPRGKLFEVRTIAKDIDNVLAGFVRGQSVVCLILAVFYGASLLIAGLEFGLIIGIITVLFLLYPSLAPSLGWLHLLVLLFFNFGQILHISV